jgi:hypothetical protein
MFFIGSAWLQQRRAISGVFDVNWCSFVVRRQLIVTA